MCTQLFLGCSGWNYPDIYEKGGWLNVFYPDKKTRKLNYYSQFFNTVEMDATFYKKFYQNMKKGLFIGLTRATPDNFTISIKVPEIITHQKRLDIQNSILDDMREFLNKISPLKTANKLGVIIIQLPPSFTVKESQCLEKFLESIKSDPYTSSEEYAMEFRHDSWNSEGVLELLKHYEIASVITDSPSHENLEYLSNENNVTSKKVGVVRLHGRNIARNHYWYDYLYTKQELKSWVDKIKKIQDQTDNVFVYFNNHYGGKAIVNALQFKEMVYNNPLSEHEIKALERAKKLLSIHLKN